MFRAPRKGGAVPRFVVIALLAAGLAMPAAGQRGPAAGGGVRTAAVTPRAAAQVSPRPVVPPVIPCAALLQQDFSAVPSAPAAISSAVVVPAAPGVPEHCDVHG